MINLTYCGDLFSILLCQSSSPKLLEFVQYFQVIPLCPKCPQDGSCFAIMKPGKSWYFMYNFCLHRTFVDLLYYTIWVHSLGWWCSRVRLQRSLIKNPSYLFFQKWRLKSMSYINVDDIKTFFTLNYERKIHISFFQKWRLK